MRIEELFIENMFVISDAHVYFRPGVIFVDGVNKDRGMTGSNQVGKSSLFDALCLALFENNSRGVIKDDAIRVGAGRGKVEVVLNGKKIVYERSLTSSSRWYVQDGERVVELAWNKMKEYIRDDVLGGLGYREFVLGNIFQQGVLSEFIIASDAERKEMFVRWFGLDKYLRARERVIEIMKDVTTQISELEGRLKELRVIEDEVRVLKEEVFRASGVDVKELIDFVRRNSERVLTEDQYRRQRKVLLEKVRKVKEAERLYDVVTALEKKVTDLTSELRVIQERLKYVRDGRCFVCGSLLPEGFVSDLARKEQELKSVLVQARRVLDEVNWVKSFVGRREEVIREFRALREKVDWGGRVSEARRLIDKLGELRRKEEQLGNRIEELTRERERLEFELRMCKVWKDGFSDDGVMLYAISECFKLLNRYLDRYAELFGFRPQCVIRKGRVVIEIDDGFRVASDVDSFSSSERYLISLVVLFGMRDFLASFGKVSNLLVLDEVFAVFDREWRSRLIGFLNKRKRVIPTETIIVITHHDDVKSALDCDEVWWLEREGGESKLIVYDDISKIGEGGSLCRELRMQ